jgi:glutathione S-transferase
VTEHAADPVLITFPPSLDSELARFLLVHYGVRHREQRHALVFSSFATLWHGFTPVFPLLYADGYRCRGPRAVVEHFETVCAPDRRLFPGDADQRRQVEADWGRFNGDLALATAAFAYFHLLPHRDLMVRPLAEGTPAFEHRSVERAYPAFAWLLRTLLRLSPKRAEEALGRIRTVFGEVEARLTARPAFLVGDRLTLSDLAFAVAAAPVVLPAAYGGPIPALPDMPAALQEAVAELRARPAGAYALRVYETRRLARSA